MGGGGQHFEEGQHLLGVKRAGAGGFRVLACADTLARTPLGMSFKVSKNVFEECKDKLISLMLKSKLTKLFWDEFW